MKFLLDFFRGVIELLQVQSTQGKRTEDDSNKEKEVVEAYEWFLEQLKDTRNRRVQINTDPWLQPGKIYIFKYIAKYREVLDPWDRHPIVLALGKVKFQNSICNVGINISWYPPKIRQEIINRIRKMYAPKYESAIKKKGQLANDQAPILLDIYNLKMALNPLGFSWAIRYYLPEGIIQPKICVCYEDWDKAIRLDQSKIFPEIEGKTNLFTFYNQFRQYVIEYNGKASENRRKIEESKKQRKYVFIK